VTANEIPGTDLKSIFVISPIGKLDESGFDFTRLFLDEIVKPAVDLAGGYEAPIRADEVRTPGSITGKVVRDIVNADVCIADLTGRNPNVMYEVAIAHAADKPVILLQQEPGGPPFDFTDERVIQYSTRADQANRARDALVEHLQNARHEDMDSQLKMTMHPVRLVFRDLQTHAAASDPQQAILEHLDTLAREVHRLQAMEERRTAFVGDEMRSSIGVSAALNRRLLRLGKEYLDGFALSNLESYLDLPRSTQSHEDLTEIVEVLEQVAKFEKKDEGDMAEMFRQIAEKLARDLPPF